jgi:hypothetical protein
MEAICSSETSVETQWTTRRHIPENDTLYNHGCENHRSYNRIFLCLSCELFLITCNYQTKCLANVVRNKQLSLLICMKTENLWNVFTREYKNREARLASLEHMVREMNISTEQGQLNCLLSIQ